MNYDNLPIGWVWTRLGEVCIDPQYGWTTSAITEGTLHLLRTTDITSGIIDWDTVPFCKEEPPEKEKYLLNDGDIVISRAGSVGYSHLIKNPKEAIFASYLIRFRPLIDEKYLAFFLKSPSYWNSISEKSLGIAIPNVNASKLKQILLPLPPLPEQCRIVTKLEELFTKLDAGVSALKKTQAQLKRYRQSVLKAACEGKLVPTEAELAKIERRAYEPADVLLARILKERREKNRGTKYKEAAAPDTSGLHELPEGWVWANVGQMTDSMKNGIYRPSEFYTEDGIACLRMYNIDQAKIVWKDIKRMNLTKDEVDEYLLVPGDLLVNRVNSRELVGKTAVIPLGIEKCVFESKNIRVRVIDKIVNPHYLCYRFASAGSEYFNKNAQQVVGMASISQPQIARFSVPLPPFAEQCRIVAEVERRLTIADGVERTLERSLRQAERLRQSILKSVFEGKLVPQNANDEPASMVLEKIKEEKVRRSEERNKTKAKTKPKNKKVDIMKTDTEELENIMGLYEIMQSSKKSLTPKELWQSSKISIDDFYSQLKIEVEKGRIIERQIVLKPNFYLNHKSQTQPITGSNIQKNNYFIASP